MQISPLIEMRSVTKEYRGIPAIRNVDFKLLPGEVHALLGENGAGKSTLTKIMAGVTQATAGEMRLDDKAVSFATPGEALAEGVAMVFQETSLVPSMTVAQNLFLGEEKLFNRLRGIYIAAQQFMQSLNFQVDPWADVATLGAAKKQMVEIARAVRQKARVIIFDEPTATLTPEEKRHFFALVRDLKARGVAVIFITHALEEALSIADRISVLRDGELVISDDADRFDRDMIVQAMVGRSLSDELYHSHGEDKIRPPGHKVLSVQNLSMSKIVKNNSFSVYGGQVTGIFGLIGSGRSETAKVVCGIYKRDFFHGGEVRLENKPVRYRTPRPAVMDGIVYVTEDRKIEGFYESMSIAENIHRAAQAANVSPGLFVSYAEMKAMAADWSDKLNIRAIDSDASVIELSGGNQQKVVIARALVQKPKVVFFDEPTRGVDVGAISEIHQLINDLAEQGIAIVVISSYLPEILNLSDRILVSRGGRIVEEFTPEEATEERIMYAAVH
ncbi:sugar ABC transporter ATP-binding protein [Celeribacter baekdonensis]|jgi:simple sugar transport system ATP-binding protein|uniref:Monosaccharide ABC transporter ATP-binding protein, CUT2 family n=2 Tax=Roseobacteraceae TaxID=2854170 RepID=A0A1G7T6F9_9RHOB|nr:sugar ABC transporter ATP-binding protein [Celeribacter baekdonensis]SDG30957.1 monosaccharide ABC transporter ATP-binding protein, CUT2 family [Celeribacter baekdonensis]